jgi:hypothetical protein
MLPASDHQPPLYRGPIQLQVGMMCHKAKHGILFTCYGGRELHVHIFDSHESTQKIIYDGVVKFEEHMFDGTYPDPISIEEVGKLYPAASDDSVKLAVDLMDSVNSYREAQEAMKLMEALGEASSGVIPGFEADTKVNWPMRNYKPKPATCCPECGFEIEPAKDGYSVRQKSITIKEVSNA